MPPTTLSRRAGHVRQQRANDVMSDSLCHVTCAGSWGYCRGGAGCSAEGERRQHACAQGEQSREGSLVAHSYRAGPPPAGPLRLPPRPLGSLAVSGPLKRVCLMHDLLGSIRCALMQAPQFRPCMTHLNLPPFTQARRDCQEVSSCRAAQLPSTVMMQEAGEEPLQSCVMVSLAATCHFLCAGACCWAGRKGCPQKRLRP